MGCCFPKRGTDLLDGLQEVLFVRRVGRDAAVTAQLQGGHEGAHGVLLVLRQLVLVIVQHLVQVEGQLGPVLKLMSE